MLMIKLLDNYSHKLQSIILHCERNIWCRCTTFWLLTISTLMSVLQMVYSSHSCCFVSHSSFVQTHPGLFPRPNKPLCMNYFHSFVFTNRWKWIDFISVIVPELIRLIQRARMHGITHMKTPSDPPCPLNSDLTTWLHSCYRSLHLLIRCNWLLKGKIALTWHCFVFHENNL